MDEYMPIVTLIGEYLIPLGSIVYVCELLCYMCTCIWCNWNFSSMICDQWEYVW